MERHKAVLDSLYLFNQSPDHSIYTLQEFNRYAIYPILHDMALLHYLEGKPVGVVTWCWLTNDEATSFLDDRLILTEEHYKRSVGDQLWGVEFIAPFGHARPIMRKMREHSHKLYGPDVAVHWRRLRQPDKLHRRRF